VLQPQTGPEAFTTTVKQKHPKFYQLPSALTGRLHRNFVHPPKDLDCITFAPSVTWQALGKGTTESHLQMCTSHLHTTDRFVSGGCHGAF